ncbi:PLP-dependent aminotransferase family protein [Streptomyces clavuligerus]|nr:PLP-dependent aminotransferase family protein [Streptomyces clavuligerus]EDY47726.1 aminotransferase [Streptomyces clavuligerus]WDN56895.1 PLP-dependent aminotransferase family protein [Streptomyces clavuligerus]
MTTIPEDARTTTPDRGGSTPGPRPAGARLSRHCAALPPSVIAEALRGAARDRAISLAAGSPAATALPVDEVRSLIDRVLTRPGALQYTDTGGLPALREWFAADVSRRTGRAVHPRRIVVTHGSQQGLDLVCRALLDPGDTVLVDRPSYSGALQLLTLHQARVRDVPIASDPELTALDRALARESSVRPVRMVYVVPSYANPTGDSLSAGQRAGLARLAERYDCVVVEDDPYRQLGFRTSSADAVTDRGSDRGSERVITLGSLSKVLSPAVRIGYLVAPEPLRTPLSRLKEAADLGNSALTQQLAHALLTTPGLLDHQVARLRGLYRERRDTLVAALREHLGDEIAFAVPDGGFFVWARLTRGLDTTELLPTALGEGVAFVPGAAFYAREPERATLRLSYATADPGELAEGCARLARAVRTAGAKRAAAPSGGA